MKVNTHIFPKEQFQTIYADSLLPKGRAQLHISLVWAAQSDFLHRGQSHGKGKTGMTSQ